MNLSDTQIDRTGVKPCCLMAGLEISGPNVAVEVGDRSSCRHCGEVFELLADDVPTWRPARQIHNK